MRRSVYAGLMACALAAGCTSDLTLPELPGGVSVSSIEPAAAYSGEVLTISGHAFHHPAEANEVAFTTGRARANWVADDGTSLTVVVPRDAGSGAVAVATPAGRSDLGGVFEYKRLGELVVVQ